MIKERLLALFPSFLFNSQTITAPHPDHTAEFAEDSAQTDPSLQENMQEEAPRRKDMELAAGQTAIQARAVSNAITKACRETDPQFLLMGRELQEIYGAAMGLTSTIQSMAMQLSQSDEGTCVLDQAGLLVENGRQALSDAQRTIENSVNHVFALIGHLEKFTSICEKITRIGIWFRVVGVNIEIECNTKNLSGDMFTSVSKEVNILSQQINQMVGEIKNDLSSAGSRLSSLAHSSSTSLAEIRQMAEKAEQIVHSSFADIKTLMAETGALIDTATAKAQIVGREVGEVVVGIQFHDSMSQRIEHIVEAFQDIEMLCEQFRDTEEPETLGSACIILEFQKKQLFNLQKEIRTLALTIQDSFQLISSEIHEMNTELTGSRLAGDVKRQHRVNLFKPLQQGLRQLGGLLATGKEMIEALQRSATDTATVADHLLKMISGIRHIREETHIKAINTIIMANQLGSQGQTIEVLAKEIRSLADQTGEMVAEISIIQEDIGSEVTALRAAIRQEQIPISTTDLEQGVKGIGKSYQEVQTGIRSVAQDTESLATQIKTVADQLSFLEELAAKIESSTEQVEAMLEILAPWQHSGQTHDENVLRLLARYTMDQERLVHTADQNQGDMQAGTEIEFFSDDDDKNRKSAGDGSFDDNIELF